MATVKLTNIKKSFGDVDIIKGVSLGIEDREFCVFVGPSGCGKSTLLRLIAGLEEITGGDLFIDGVRSNDVPPPKRGLAMVFQSYALYPHMSVADNMGFSLKLGHVAKEERDKKVNDAARVLQLEPLLHRKPKELSGGQRQRVAIGRAIVRNPKVFLFDEPLSNLDAALRVRMRLELTKLHKQLNATMIYVTHDQVEAMTMADKIVVMQAGVIEQVGSPMDLYRSPRNLFVAGFIGSPRMNFLPVVAKEAGLTGVTVALPDSTVFHVPVASEWTEPGEKMTFGVRPEHLTLSSESGLPAQIQVVEHLGGESYLHVQIASGETLVVKVDGETEASPNQQIQLKMNEKFMYLFDRNGDAMKPLSLQSASL